MQIVQEAAAHHRRIDLARAPFGMRIRRPLPQRGRIRLLLDQERAAGLRRVLAGHVERQHRDHALDLVRVILDPLPAAAISSTQRNVSVRAGAGSAPRRIAVLHRERGREQRAAAAGVVVRARLLHVRGEDDALFGMRCGPGISTISVRFGPRWKRVSMSTCSADVALRELGAQARRDPRRRLEAERIAALRRTECCPTAARRASPRASCTARSRMEITPAAPRARTASVPRLAQRCRSPAPPRP